jgi:acyl-CoA synthetase (NDP forming)
MAGLDRLLRPRSIAVIGGGVWCENVIEQCIKIGFDGDLWPVHPTRARIGQRTAFATLKALPNAPDAVFIGVNRHATIDVVAQLAAMGAGGAICFASGFSEAQNELDDSVALQDALVAAAGDMTIIGPNCYGLLNYLDGVALWPDQHGGLRTERGVAILTQSSNIAINLTMQRRGLPLAYVATAGNQAQIGLSELGMALLDDPRVTALGLHIEGIDDLAGFERLAHRAHDLGKPIVALKIGASDQAQMATLSHTASLAGSDAGARALLARLGIGQVRSLAGLVETLKLMHVAGPLSSNRIASMSCSGGEASLMADAVLGTDLCFAPLSTIQQQNLRAALGPKVALANPLDYNTYIWGDLAAMTQTFTAMMDPSLAMGCVVLDFPRPDRCQADDWDLVIEAVHAAQDRSQRRIAILASLPENLPEDVSIRLITMGVVPFCGISEAVEAMAVGASMTAPDPTNVLPPRPIRAAQVLTEAEAKADLARFGIQVPKAQTADSPKAAGRAADAIGYPVALKGLGLTHKTEAGAVALNLRNCAHVVAHAAAMPTKAFLVEQMVDDVVAELLVGVVLDPAHGYVLTIAAGGTLTEILTDSASVLIPASRASLTAALARLKIAPILAGYRGAPPANMDAIIQTLMLLQDYVCATPVHEVEINPLLATPTAAIAVDALIKKDCDNDG